jgi:hypothetical protein
MIERRDEHGVLLRYATDIRGPHHDARRVWPSDRLRGSILRSERELRDMHVILEALEATLSDVCIDRLLFSLRTFEGTLNLAREEIARRLAG